MKFAQVLFYSVIGIALVLGLFGTLHTSQADVTPPQYLYLQVQPAQENLSPQIYRITLYADGEARQQLVTDIPPHAFISPNLTPDWITQVLAQTEPLSGPRDFIPVPNSSDKQVIFAMTGPSDNYVNLYLLDEDGAIQQLTQTEALWEGTVLSVSTSFIAWRPHYEGQFLYRTRVLDVTGKDHNHLWVYDLNRSTAFPAPYFGDQVVWSLDGNQLAGIRLDTSITPPLYQIWIEDLTSGKARLLDYGCMPKWSPNGEWLAYQGHTNSQWQGYTSCYADGRVFAVHLTTTQPALELSDNLSGFVTLLYWEE
jgi:hypothetical protein